AKPSSLEYWHIGETAIRFWNITSRSVNGSNRCGMVFFLKGCLRVVAGHAIIAETHRRQACNFASIVIVVRSQREMGQLVLAAFAALSVAALCFISVFYFGSEVKLHVI